jgi:hypothetical protein
VPSSSKIVAIDPADVDPVVAIDPADVDSGPSVMEPLGHKIKRIGKVIGQHTVAQAAGAAPIAAGAEMGAGLGSLGGPAAPITVPLGGLIGGAIGALAAPAAQYAAGRAVGLPEEKPTWEEALSTAKTNAQFQMGAPIVGELPEALVEGVLGIRGAGQLVREGRVAGAEAREDLTAKQADTRADIANTRLAAGSEALRKHASTLSDADAAVDAARQKLRESVQRDVAKAFPGVAEDVAQGQVGQMIGKTRAQFQAEAAQPYEKRASALSATTTPYFDASAKFHQEVGAKFDPYIEKIKTQAIPPAGLANLDSTVASITKTVEERGQRIESADLRSILDTLKTKEPDVQDPGARATKTDLGRKLDPNNPKDARIIKQMREQGFLGASENEQPTTYGQLWGMRSRANRILAGARNPADRNAARELVGAIDDQIPNIPPEIRSQYAFERKIARPLFSKVATARTPQEVGEAIYGSKANPEPAEVPLQIIRFTKKYAPDQVDGLRQAFADRYLGNQMDANDLGKMNPQVLRELYGDKSDSVIRLLGPEGDIKQAGWGALIRTDPQAAETLKDTIRESVQKQRNLAQRQAMADGERLAASLPPKYAYVKQHMNALSAPEDKLKILAMELPEPDAVAKEGLRTKLQAGRLEGYAARRLAFTALLGAMGGYSYLFRNPDMLAATVALGTGLGARGMARYALGTESGADLYMKALDMKPTPENAAAFGRTIGALGTAAITDQARQNASSEAVPTPASSPTPSAVP